MAMILVLTVCYTLIVVWYVLSPHYVASSEGTQENETSPWRHLSDQKERLVQVLRDLELDFQTKKINEEDFASMKASVSAELGAVLARLDAEAARASSSSSTTP